jgi:hypothetical protein
VSAFTFSHLRNDFFGNCFASSSCVARRTEAFRSDRSEENHETGGSLEYLLPNRVSFVL